MTDKCHVTLINKEVILEPNEQVDWVTLYVAGMGCPNCAKRVHNRLIDHPGVIKAEVRHETATAEVAYLPTKINVSELIDLVAEAGDARHAYTAMLWQEASREHSNSFVSVIDVAPTVKARSLSE